MAKNNNSEFAGFWLRFVAYIIDSLVVGIPIAVIGGLMMAIAPLLVIVYILSVLLGPWLYFSLMESSSKQATLGKMAIGAKVTDLSGNRISFGKATGRFFSKIISSILFVGFIMIGFTEKKQGLHDMIAGTLVIKSR